LKIFKEGTDFFLYKYEGIVGSYTDSEPIMQRHCREKQIDSTLLSLQDQFNMIKNSIKIKSINTFRKLDILYNNQLYHIEDGLKINNDFIKFIDNCGPD
jgi:hypothetical protein